MPAARQNSVEYPTQLWDHLYFQQRGSLPQSRAEAIATDTTHIAARCHGDTPLLTVLLIGVFYPLWLISGFIDYICHRRSDIAKSSGSTESWLHVAQFVSLGLTLLLAVLLAITPLTFALLAGLVVVHTILSFMDVSYTDGRRYISPLEQHAHGFMDVLPIVGVCLIGALNWDELHAAPWTLNWKQPPIPELQRVTLIGSYFILAGVPIFEELLRTLTSKVKSPSVFDNRPKTKDARRADQAE